MIGTRLGPYQITAKLGEGGMGEVYRATDTKLKREVAIKVLPAAFTEDRERLARFEREAHLLAQLNHPNIAVVHGLEESGAVRALVMELVEGPTLADRLESGPLPVAESLSIARQIAEALESAHERGIVHRDLKPQNIKAAIEGRVKVLDFGLAKAMDSMGSTLGPGSAAQLAQSPTLTFGATQIGVILGTAAYMAPEQAKGLPVDKRADIWAFGVVLFEMLSGERLFIGETVPETLAAVIRAEIDLARLPATTPPPVRELLQRCLERDPKRRLRDIGEARLVLEAGAESTPAMPWSAAAQSTAANPPRLALRRRDLWVAIAFVTTVAAAIVGLLLERTDRARTEAQTAGGRATRLAFFPADGVTADEGTYDATIVSPNGQMLLFTGRSVGGRRQLWLRPLDAMATRPLPDTEDAIEPFWAPDSRAVGFGAGGKLQRIDLAGGKAQALADAPRLNGGAWSRDGVILFSPDFNAGLYRVPAAGGETTLVSRPDPARGEAAHHLPCFLPDGRRFLYRVASASDGPSRLFAGALDSGEVKELLADAALAVFAPPHWLLYARNEVLVAQALDSATLELREEPVPVATGLIGGAGFNSSRFSVSDNGVLILQNPKPHDYRLVWFDRAGHRLGAVGPPAQVINNGQSPEISPDGKRVTVQRADPKTRNEDIWVIDLERGTENRLTIDPGYDQLPVWSPDSSSVFFARRGLYRVAASGGREERLLEGTVFPKDVSVDGRLLLFAQRGEKTRADIWALPLSGERRPYPLLQSEFDEYQPQVSPDGRWLAYNSDQTGRQELYVRPLLAAGKLGEATQISVGSGVHPRWRRDGRELYYVAAPTSSLDGLMMAVAVKTSGSTFEVGAPTELFKVAMFPNTTAIEYDVTADGQRFLVGTVEAASNAAAVTIVLNWTADLQR